MRYNVFNTNSGMKSVPNIIELDFVFIIFNTPFGNTGGKINEL